MDARNNILTEAEIALAEKALQMAQEAGAAKCRMTLAKSVLDLAGTLNGELDKVQHCLDRSLSVALFVDGRFGTFSTNRLEETELRAFLGKAVETVRMLAADPFRDLPARERVAQDAVRGDEAATWDPEGYASVTPESLVETALADAWYSRFAAEGFEIISEEGELSLTASESLLIDSEGARCRCRETLFEYGVETTVRCLATGEKVSGYWWDSRPRLAELDHAGCGKIAAERAVAAAGAEALPSGKYRMAVSTECAGKLVTPLLNALGGYTLQQKNSFLTDTLGKAVFSPKLRLRDEPRIAGINGARWYDSEGAATQNQPVIEDGVVKTYFLNTYMAAKMGMAPTIEDAMRPVLVPTLPGVSLAQWLGKEKEMVVVVEGFNGGNHNPATGDFSYGVEGFALVDGAKRPVKEMLITGNFLTLWKDLAAVFDDARPCSPKSLPGLLFDNVDFSG